MLRKGGFITILRLMAKQTGTLRKDYARRKYCLVQMATKGAKPNEVLGRSHLAAILGNVPPPAGRLGLSGN